MNIQKTHKSCPNCGCRGSYKILEKYDDIIICKSCKLSIDLWPKWRIMQKRLFEFDELFHNCKLSQEKNEKFLKKIREQFGHLSL